MDFVIVCALNLILNHLRIGPLQVHGFYLSLGGAELVDMLFG